MRDSILVSPNSLYSALFTAFDRMDDREQSLAAVSGGKNSDGLSKLDDEFKEIEKVMTSYHSRERELAAELGPIMVALRKFLFTKIMDHLTAVKIFGSLVEYGVEHHHLI